MPCESFDIFLLVIGKIFAKAKKLAHFGVPFVQISLSQTKLLLNLIKLCLEGYYVFNLLQIFLLGRTGLEENLQLFFIQLDKILG